MMLEKLFKLKAHNTTVRTEIVAGITTFLAMAYILFVNPSLLGATGMDKGAVFVATCLAAAGFGAVVIAGISSVGGWDGRRRCSGAGRRAHSPRVRSSCPGTGLGGGVHP